MRILIDMNQAFRWADMLTVRGIEAVHWAEIGPGDAPDTDIIFYAENNGYVILTNDLDFGTILAFSGADKPSVIQLRAADVRPEDLIETVCNALFRFSAEIEKGAILTIDLNKERIRILPLRENN